MFTGMPKLVWGVGVFAAALLLLSAAIVSCESERMPVVGSLDPLSEPRAGGSTAASTAPAAVPVPSKDAFLHPQGDYFGVSTLSAPDSKETDLVAAAAGHQPTMLEYFVNWSQPFDPSTVAESYNEGALPLLTWEPDGGAKDPDQPAYALAKITSGKFDRYITAFAQGVAKQRWPVVLRLAQEMNGNWYPWSEQNSGNRPGDFVRAWQHIHDIFTEVGATNVIWLWSPNVLRGTGDVDITKLYPGPSYVDWVGVDAYGFGEKTASEVLDPTVAILQRLTSKPILLAETGAKAGAEQAGWTTDLFRWLGRHQQVVGFVWFQHNVAEGGQYNYRFTDNPKTEDAFRAGLSTIRLRSWPVDPVATGSP